LRSKIVATRRLPTIVALLALFGAYSNARAATYETLFSFSAHTGGANPYYSGVVQDPKTGDLYGTTYAGGNGTCQCGVVFQIAPDGTETVVHNFGTNGDGDYPVSGVIRDTNGNLYGTTSGGGANFAGTVFKISSKGKETLLHSFDTTDGATPMGQMVMDKSGNLYGAAYSGGPAPSCCGTVFKVTAGGKFSVLYNFFYGTDGYDNTGIGPEGGLIIDSKGNLVGTTYFGGETPGLSSGTVFSVTPKGVTTVLHTFGNGKDGAHPNGGVIQDSSGNFFGTTVLGGTYGFGSVYKLTRSGNSYVESVLYSFTNQSDGENPFGSLVEDSSGNLYGSTSAGGDPECRCGTIFKLATDGTFSALHAFATGNDGHTPTAGLLAGSDGNLYGTTASGGSKGGFGTVFELPY
jgi:uncharacterized repeat protein (TIGR03803 family)